MQAGASLGTVVLIQHQAHASLQPKHAGCCFYSPSTFFPVFLAQDGEEYLLMEPPSHRPSREFVHSKLAGLLRVTVRRAVSPPAAEARSVLSPGPQLRLAVGGSTWASIVAVNNPSLDCEEHCTLYVRCGRCPLWVDTSALCFALGGWLPMHSLARVWPALHTRAVLRRRMPPPGPPSSPAGAPSSRCCGCKCGTPDPRQTTAAWAAPP